MYVCIYVCANIAGVTCHDLISGYNYLLMSYQSFSADPGFQQLYKHAQYNHVRTHTYTHSCIVNLCLNKSGFQLM